MNSQEEIKKTESEEKNNNEAQKEKSGINEILKSKDAEQNEIDDLLKAKEERFYGKDREEEVEEEEKELTSFGKFKKKIGFFVDYYKWFVIIPAIIIVIAVIMITSYLNESRERALELSIMNAAYDIPDVIYYIENDYIGYTGNAIDAKDIRMEINLQYPDAEKVGSDLTQDEVTSMQKFNAMVIAGRVDIAMTNTWVIDAYSITDSTLDLRELFDEDFLKEHEEEIYYAKDSTGEEIPVAFYIKADVIKNAYEDEELPLVVSFDSSAHREETKRFMEWILN